MPIYEYQCLHCDGSFEKLVLRRDQTVSCPSCSSQRIERQPSTFGFARSAAGGGDYASSSSASCASCTSKNCASCH